jgi:hypothetical protein
MFAIAFVFQIDEDEANIQSFHTAKRQLEHRCVNFAATRNSAFIWLCDTLLASAGKCMRRTAHLPPSPLLIATLPRETENSIVIYHLDRKVRRSR